MLCYSRALITVATYLESRSVEELMEDVENEYIKSNEQETQPKGSHEPKCKESIDEAGKVL